MAELAFDNVLSPALSPSASERACRRLVRTLATLVERLELREHDAAVHARAVAALAVEVAAQLALTPDETWRVRLGALLHDVGKLAVPDAVLGKPGPLTSDEWTLMREHPCAGVDTLAPLLRRSAALDAASAAAVLAIVRSHHERWDGCGYPDGLAADEIPLGARIVAVADAFRAMTETRPYRPALAREDALAELARESGGQFDPLAVGALLAVA